MHLASWLTVSYAMLVVQISLCPYVAVADCAPQVLWLGVIVGAIRLRGNASICWGTWMGLLADCLTPYTLGVGALTGLILSAWLQQIREREWQSVTGRFLLTFLVVGIGFTLPAAVSFLQLTDPPDWFALLSQGGGTAMLTSVWATGLLILRLCFAGLTGWNFGSETTKDNYAYRWRMLTD